MPKIEKSLRILDAISEGNAVGYLSVDPRASFIVTLAFLGVMLSVPTAHIDLLLWFALYPILTSPLLGLSYSSIFLKSLVILPLVILLGIFSPFYDTEQVANFNGITITNGWLMFIGIILRGLLSMQALLILIGTMGFVGMVRTMRELGLPDFIVTQLLMVYRYIRVLIEEAITMKAARDSRSYGNKHLPIKLWGVLVGQLFLRSIERAERIHKAMQARGFNGDMPFYYAAGSPWTLNSTVYMIGWIVVFIFLRLFNLSLLFV